MGFNLCVRGSPLRDVKRAIDRERERQRERETERERQRQTDRQRETERDREIERERKNLNTCIALSLRADFFFPKRLTRRSKQAFHFKHMYKYEE